MPTAPHRLLARSMVVSACFLVFLAAIPPARAQVNVTTYHNDNARTGRNLNETLLTPATVNKTGFGRIFTQPVDGYIYAQPLLMNGINIAGKGVHNIVLVATEHNSVYAFDADNNVGSNAAPLWQVNFGTPVTSAEVGSADIEPEIGITGTPVIDPATGTLYVVAKTKEIIGGNVSYAQRLHALNISSGAERSGSPVLIQASVPGTGDGTDGLGHVPFNALRENQRPGLVLSNGIVYVAFASHGDNGPYHGWVLGYNAATLALQSVYNTTPNGGLGGIWQAGAAPAVDSAGNLYFVTGNGTFDAAPGFGGGTSLGDSVIKLYTSGGLSVLDWFTPFNQDDLSVRDIDLGSGGALVLPDQSGPNPHLLVFASKEGKIYLLNRDNMGHYNAAGDTQIVQSFLANHGAWSMPAYFNGRIYVQGIYDTLKAYALTSGLLNPSPVMQTGYAFGYPGATPSITANGTASGIVWTIENATPAVLHAYNAEDLSSELYSSAMIPERDSAGGGVKFAVPTVANGKVYVGARYEMDVYGQGTWVATPVVSPNGGDFTGPVSVSISDVTAGAEIRYTTDGTTPTQQSPLYTAPFTVSQATTVSARAFQSGLIGSVEAKAYYLIGDPSGQGDGLWATYYQNSNLTGITVNRIDPTIAFTWNGSSPAPGTVIGGSFWSARWTGQVQARTTGAYTFYTVSDDGVRLWVNDILVIDNWTVHGATEDRATVNMVAGQKINIKMEYFQGQFGSEVDLLWSAAGVAKQPIPTSQLYSGHVAKPVITPPGGIFNLSVQVTITDSTANAAIYYTTDGSNPTPSSRLYTGPFTLTASATVKAMAFKSGSVDSPLVSAAFIRNSNTPAYQINSGGDTATPYSADAFFTGFTGGALFVPIDTSQVTNPAPQAAYQTYRWGTFSYAFPNLKPGAAYIVRLHFAELAYSSPGQRVFNVGINGAGVLSNFDIVAAAGGPLRAVVREFKRNADSAGKITLQFGSVQDFPMINAIEIIPN
jgi:hypothetical protein